MALGKHNLRAALLAERIAQALGNAMVAPVVAYVPEGGIDPPTGHMRFPGTISVPAPRSRPCWKAPHGAFAAPAFATSCCSAITAAIRTSLAAVSKRLEREWATANARVHVPAAYYRAAEQDFAAALAARGYRDGGDRHARGSRRYVAHAGGGARARPRDIACARHRPPPTASTATRAGQAPSSVRSPRMLSSRTPSLQFARRPRRADAHTPPLSLRRRIRESPFASPPCRARLVR